MVRTIIRLCPSIRLAPNVTISTVPQYFYEATDLEHFKLYESNSRSGGFESTINMIYDQTCSQYDFFQKEIQNNVYMLLNGRDTCVLTFGSPVGGGRYCVYGTTEYPGIVYRSMEAILSEIRT